MKKFFFATLLAAIVMSTAFAADVNKVNAYAIKSFTNEFKNASDVNWSVTEDYFKAAFTLDGQKMEAFYNATGEMIGSSKSITLDELPLNAKRSFAKRFEGYTVKEAILFEGSGETAYYISAETEKESVILKVNDANQISTFKRIKK